VCGCIPCQKDHDDMQHQTVCACGHVGKQAELLGLEQCSFSCVPVELACFQNCVYLISLVPQGLWMTQLHVHLNVVAFS
jgi:hypothetical protein